ncbi:hypothetical protein QHH11_25675, partial [Aphanizomenon sp. PH219]|nr:hypothetical protein [Aphanizomenon sp. PH219]
VCNYSIKNPRVFRPGSVNLANWLLVIGYWSLVIGYWLLGIGNRKQIDMVLRLFLWKTWFKIIESPIV